MLVHQQVPASGLVDRRPFAVLPEPVSKALHFVPLRDQCPLLTPVTKLGTTSRRAKHDTAWLMEYKRSQRRARSMGGDSERDG